MFLDFVWCRVNGLVNVVVLLFGDWWNFWYGYVVENCSRLWSIISWLCIVWFLGWVFGFDFMLLLVSGCGVGYLFLGWKSLFSCVF